MIRDPLYRKIVERLGGPLDADAFENCAASLLRKIYPTLVLIPGGCDSGMDGAIALLDKPAIPLVSTTRKRVIDNLRGSLASYLKNSGKSRDVVLATSQGLSRKRRDNLENAARALGFRLLQVYDQSSFAEFLYRDPPWRKELLGLDGDPSALSALPVSNRPIIEHTLVARDRELRELRAGQGDALVVGQPGTGKTSLFRRLANKDNALFVISDDLGQIADCIRSESPDILLVDDAHLRIDLLRQLRHMRGDSSFSFRIIGNCWPGSRDDVRVAMQLHLKEICELQLLTKNQMAQVVELTGLLGPGWLVQEIINQAGGRPGLAVTLCEIVRTGDIHEVTLAKQLSQDVRLTLQRLVGSDATEILAAFALGGDQGMPLKETADALQIPSHHLRHMVARLAPSGVVEDRDGRFLLVRPEALRHALVRDVFFAGAASLPIEDFIKVAPNMRELTRTLLGACARGAAVPGQMIVQLLRASRSQSLWNQFAWLGESEAQLALREWPSLIFSTNHALLAKIPQEVIPLLLSAAVGDDRPLNSHPEHPMRLLQDWIRWPRAGTEEALRRRTTLAKQVESWVGKAGNDVTIALRAMSLCFSAGWERIEPKPGDGSTGEHRWGGLSAVELRRVAKIWKSVRRVVSSCNIEDWVPILEIVSSWAFPSGRGPFPEDGALDVLKDSSREMVTDLIELARHEPGVLRRLKEISEKRSFDLSINVESSFETLFPVREVGNWEVEDVRHAAKVRDLAHEWSSRNPKEIAERLCRHEQSARAAGIGYPRYSPFLCTNIAALVDRSDEWAASAVQVGLSADLVQPFLDACVKNNLPGGMHLMEECLQDESLRIACVNIALTRDVPAELCDATLAVVSGHESIVSMLCFGGRISEPVLSKLLKHSDGSIAAATAVAIWEADPKHTVPSQLINDWQDAIINQTSNEWCLREIFDSFPDLAFPWLECRTRGNDCLLAWERSAEILDRAVSSLTDDQRWKLLVEVRDDFRHNSLVRRLVDDDVERFRRLLTTQPPRGAVLAPLERELDEMWCQLAIAAADAGYDAREIWRATEGTALEFHGNESECWQERIDQLERLSDHKSDQIKDIVDFGLANMRHLRQIALKDEREEAIHGRREFD